MTKILIDKETVTQVIEALDDRLSLMKWQKAREFLRQALEQSTEQEPVAWLHWLYGPVQVFLNKDEAMMELDRLNREYPVDDDSRQMKSLYTQPQEAAPLQSTEQEPVAWETFALKFANGTRLSYEKPTDLPKYLDCRPLYTQPQEAARKPLTDEQIWDAYMKAPVDIDCHVSDLHKFARAIEAAHGITGEKE